MGAKQAQMQDIAAAKAREQMLHELSKGQTAGAAQGALGSALDWWGQNAAAFNHYVAPTYTLTSTSGLCSSTSYNAGSLKGS